MYRERDIDESYVSQVTINVQYRRIYFYSILNLNEIEMKIQNSNENILSML